ncbi:MAG: division/cell wall cluster transcriptional repressor MraZ [Myxococcales bacterium]|nr:division/cell wall cluster transcriptional repressor MraZ [Myxococcales bacterium]
MFRGHYEHTIDPKGRTSIPACFRHLFPVAEGVRLVIAKSVRDACLDVWPMPAWEELEAKVAGFNRWDRDIVLFRRRYLSAAVEAEVDAHGRVLIPQAMRSFAALEKDVLWAGVGTTMELWSGERWEAALELPAEALSRWTDAIAEKLNA